MEKSGWKKIPGQFITYPFIGPLHFTERRDLLIPENALEPATSLQAYLEANRLKYRQFIRQKSRYPTLDMYACFQPFNEAFKALYNFVSYMQDLLAPGDVVLNLWDRSGWTASMLAGWFPEQQIWTIWEGDKDILGYKGFDHWMSPERRSSHTVLFADFERPLPIASKSIAAVVGFDLLHRFHQPDLLREIDRIAKPSAPVLFPHVHLTNSFPEPFFERGCRQLHGNHYAAMFNELEAVTHRTGYILSEPAAFRNNDFGPLEAAELVSMPAHADYNGCIAWLDAGTKPYLRPWRGHIGNWKQSFLLQNPFLSLHSILHKIEWNTSLYADQIQELLQRHSIYKQRITPAIGKGVPEQWMKILYWASEGKTLDEIINHTEIAEADMQAFLEECWKLDLAQAVPVDAAGFRLQTLLGRQQYLPEKHEQQLHGFWKQAVAFYGPQAWIKTGDEILSYEQGDELIQLTQKALVGEGLKKGDRLLVCAALHYETLIIFWAAVGLGIVVVPVSPKESRTSIQCHVERMEPAMAFTDPQVFDAVSAHRGVKVIMADRQDDAFYSGEHTFEALLSRHVNSDVAPADFSQPDDIAVILSTTGSTGNPKSIPLTHAQLIRSGRIMTETYQWKRSDRYFALGGLETMSGLRNATVCIAEAGATCVPAATSKTIHDHYAGIQHEQITIIAANPLFFRQLLFAAHTAGSHKPFSSVRLALCTGNVLTASLRKQWQQNTGSALLNYYGLTETSGICIAEPPGFIFSDERSIGIPAGCMIKIVGEQGNDLPPGETGELCIYGAGNFSGYYQNAAATAGALKHGWFHTKDLAFISADGSVCLCGRMTDIVKLPSGERIEISAIEEVIASMKLVDDWAVCPIREAEKESAAVFFVPVANITVEETITQIKNTIAEKIGLYAVPKIVAAVGSIPRGNHNKVLRKALTDSLTNA